MTYSVYSLNFSNLFPQQSDYLMMITLYFLLSICWTLLSMGWFIMSNDFITKAQMPKLLYAFSGLLQRISFKCFHKSKVDNKMDQNKDIIIENSQINKSQDQNIQSISYQTQTTINKIDERNKQKCDFCNRCESCQAEVDKDKIKAKNKKEIEAKCGALNYLVFLCILLFMFVSDMAIWLSMPQ